MSFITAVMTFTTYTNQPISESKLTSYSRLPIRACKRGRDAPPPLLLPPRFRIVAKSYFFMSPIPTPIDTHTPVGASLTRQPRKAIATNKIWWWSSCRTIPPLLSYTTPNRHVRRSSRTELPSCTNGHSPAKNTKLFRRVTTNTHTHKITIFMLQLAKTKKNGPLKITQDIMVIYISSTHTSKHGIMI